MFSIFFNIILILIGYFFANIVGYLGTLLLIIDIYYRYFDLNNIKVFPLFIVAVSLSGYVWDRSLFAIIIFNILFIIVFITSNFIKKQ